MLLKKMTTGQYKKNILTKGVQSRFEREINFYYQKAIDVRHKNIVFAQKISKKINIEINKYTLMLEKRNQKLSILEAQGIDHVNSTLKARIQRVRKSCKTFERKVLKLNKKCEFVSEQIAHIEKDVHDLQEEMHMLTEMRSKRTVHHLST